MAVSMRAVPALAVVLLASVFVVADDAQNKSEKASGDAKAAAAEAKGTSEARPRAVRLTKPWSTLTSLTDDQKRQINQIHRKAVQEIRAVEQRERADVMALLNAEQKAELTALEEKEAAERKARAAQRPTRSSAGSGTSQSRSENKAQSDAAVASDKAEADEADEE